MPTFLLKFERYIQEAAWKRVRAKDLDAAMAKAMDVDTHELDWADEGESTHPRLYGVFDGRKHALVNVETEHRHDTSWTAVDLRYQWGRAPLTDKQLVQMNTSLKQWLVAMQNVPPVFANDSVCSRWFYLAPWDHDPTDADCNLTGEEK